MSAVSHTDRFAALIRVARERALTEAEAGAAMALLADGAPSPAAIREFLTAPALSFEEVAVSTLVGLARTARARAADFPFPAGALRLDTCGTGGGRATFNISTAAALLLAALGRETTPAFFVVKHGNRAVASRSGSADVLESLGLELGLEPEANARLLEETGFAFFFAPKYHRAFAHVGPVRRELAAAGVRTAFNLIGPLTNPAGATHQIVGLFSTARLRVMAEALSALGLAAGLAVATRTAAGDVLDELAPVGVVEGLRLRDGAIHPFAVTPEEMGLGRFPPEALDAADAAESAALIRSVLSGTAAGTAVEAAATMNAAALLHLATGESLRAAADRCRALAASGAALRHLDRIVSRSRSLAT